MVKISIIVPVYKTQQYLEKCLDTLINQTLESIEIITINDGSPDNSIDILNEYAHRDSRIKVITIENKGLSGARNVGIELAQGEFIMFVDSDDWIDLDTCEKAYKYALDYQADAVIFCYISEYSDHIRKKTIYNEDKIIYDNQATLNKLLCGFIGLTREQLRVPEKIDTLISAWGKLYKTSIVKKFNIKFIDLTKIPSEAQLFNIEYYIHIKRAVYIKKYFYHYRRDNISSLTKVYRTDLLGKWLNWATLVKGFIGSSISFNDGIYEAYYNRICFSIIPLATNCVLMKDNKLAIQELKLILNDPTYKHAYMKIKLKYFPTPWKIYFGLAKHRCVFPFYCMCKLIKLILDYRNK